MEKVSLIFLSISFIIKATLILPYSIKESLTPNYRSLLSTPINIYSNDSWVLGYNTQPSGWNISNNIISLPFCHNSTNGI